MIYDTVRYLNTYCSPTLSKIQYSIVHQNTFKYHVNGEFIFVIFTQQHSLVPGNFQASRNILVHCGR